MDSLQAQGALDNPARQRATARRLRLDSQPHASRPNPELQRVERASRG